MFKRHFNVSDSVNYVHAFEHSLKKFNCMYLHLSKIMIYNMYEHEHS